MEKRAHLSIRDEWVDRFMSKISNNDGPLDTPFGVAGRS